MKKIFAAAAVIAMSCALFSCGAEDNSKPVYTTIALNSPVTDPLTDYFDGMNDCEAEKLIASMYPQVYIDSMKADSSYNGFVSDVDDYLKDNASFWEENYGANSNLKADGNIMGTEMSGYEISNAEKYLNDSYTEYGQEFKLSEGYAISFDYIVSGDKDKLEGKQNACLVNIEGDGWKLMQVDIEVIKRYNGAEVSLGGNDNNEQ